MERVSRALIESLRETLRKVSSRAELNEQVKAAQQGRNQTLRQRPEVARLARNSRVYTGAVSSEYDVLRADI